MVQARRKTLGAPGRSLVSDRAPALIKLAKTGLDGLSIPEVLPLIRELVKSSAWAIGSRLRQARPALRHAPEHLATLQDRDPDGTEAALARVALAPREAEVRRWERVHDASRLPLEAVSLSVPPWRGGDATPQRAQEVESPLPADSDAREALIETQGLPVKKQALDKVRRQRADLSALIDLWWQGVWQAEEPRALPPPWTRGSAQALLPLH